MSNLVYFILLIQRDTGLENVQAVSPEMVEAGQFGYASETKTAESEEIRHQEQYASIHFRSKVLFVNSKNYKNCINGI